MNPIVTISLEGSDHQGNPLRAQTAFAYSQRHTAEAKGAIEALHRRVSHLASESPRGTLCTDGFIRIRKV